MTRGSRSRQHFFPEFAPPPSTGGSRSPVVPDEMASKYKGSPSGSPHDRFFRSYFQRPDILQALAEFVLPSEHKSWSDSWVTLQLLRYMTRIWSRHERENRRLPLPPVIPIVIYHGRSRRAHTDFASLFAEELPPSLRRHCPGFRVETLNLTGPGVCRTYGQN